MDRLRRIGLACLVLGPTLLSTCAEPPREALTAGLSEESGWLRAYLQFDTSNPPGNVEPAAAYLARILDRAGIDYEMLDQGDGRPSLLARLPPARPAPDSETLLLLHHLDVVEADDLWRVPPFAGEVHDGVLWGRGAIDSKSLGIAHLAALVALQRSGVERRRGVAFFASAEEEMGGRLGVERWLKQRPDLFSDVTTVVTEGGTNRGYDGRLHWWGIEIAQKRPLWLEARASTPQALVTGLRRLVDLPPAWRVSPQAELTFARLAPHYNEHWRSIFLDLPRVITATGPSVGLLPGMEIFFLDSVQVNELEVLSDGGARARIDVRLLPDSRDSEWLERIRALLGPGVEAEVLLSAPEVEASPWDNTWIEILERQLTPTAPIVPQMAAGITDSRYFRQREIAAYGFSPFIIDSVFMRTVHVRDERIPLVRFEKGVERMTALVAEWAEGAAD
ncbi:MAG: M20/M25/M40 family metallo-hydrolase [Acidobacteria bacterium]|nr:M20/M25/M40 family metallo-hydrolase [Acidobacteriota bacterium]